MLKKNRRLTLRTLLVDHYLGYAIDLADSTVSQYHGHVTRWEKYAGKTTIHKIDTAMFMKFRGSCCEEGLSPFSTEGTVGGIKALLKYAVNVELLKKFPFPGRALKRTIKIKHVPSLEAIGAAYSNVGVTTWPQLHVPPPLFWQCFIVAMYFTGLRVSDLMRTLKWDTISKDQILLQAGKSDRIQILPAHDVLFRHLKAMRGHHGERVFPVSKSPHLIRRELMKISVAAGIVPHLTPQAFRRRAGTEYEAVRATAGQKLLGHLAPCVSDFYILPQCLFEASKGLSYPAEFDSGPDVDITPVHYAPRKYEPLPPPTGNSTATPSATKAPGSRWLPKVCEF